MPLTDHPAEGDTSKSLEERKFDADLDHQRAERDREDKKLKFKYLAMAGFGPLSAGTLALIGIVVVQIFSIIVEKQKFEGNVIIYSLNASDSDHAKANLKFALDNKLIPDYADQIQKVLDNKTVPVPFNPQPQVAQLQPQQPPKPPVVAPSYKDAPEHYELHVTSRTLWGFVPAGFTCRQYIARWDAAVFSPDDKIRTCRPAGWKAKPPYQPIAYPDSGAFFEDGKPPRLVRRCEDAEHGWAMNETKEAMFNPNYKLPKASRNPECVPLRIQ